MNKKTKSSIILSSLCAIGVAGSLIAGSTYALFTSESKTNIAVTSGTVDVTASIDKDSLVTYSGVNLIGDSTDTIEKTTTQGTFTNGGTATIEGDTLTLDKMTPGDKVSFDIKVKNNSNVAVKYRTKANYEFDNGLSEALDITINGETFNRKIITSYKTFEDGSAEESVPVVVSMPSTAGNEYQGLSCKISYTVEAIQGNAVGDSDSYPVYPTGVTEDDFTNNNATLAYFNEEGEITYSANFSEVVTKTTASEIFCKANSSIEGGTDHMKFNRDLTIYGNNSNFNYCDLSVAYMKGFDDLLTSATLKLYDTNNLAVWGSTIKTGVTFDLYMEGCTITGRTSYDNTPLVLLKSQEDNIENQGTINATLKYCKATNVLNGYTIPTKGNTTIENCVFRDCYIGVKTKLKTNTNGTRVDTIKNCLFVNCGTASTADEVNRYCAPISYSNDNDRGKFNGSLTLNSINNKFYNSIGENGDILLGDNRGSETFNEMTLHLESEDIVTVRKAHKSIDTYSAGTHEIVCPANVG